MGTRSVQELPVRILTNDELLDEVKRTSAAAATARGNGQVSRSDANLVRRNAAAMEELLHRGSYSIAAARPKTA